MSDRRYSSPLALERAITDRARSQAALDAERATFATERGRRDFIGRRMNQLRRDVAVHAIVRRLQDGEQGATWVIKGGVALQLRLDPSRPSMDIDVVRAGVDVEHSLTVELLRAALRIEHDDYFRFELDDAASSLTDDRALTLPVTAYLGTRRYERFDIDLAPPRDDVEYELLEPSPAPLGIEQLGNVSVNVLRIELQLADKVCAMHEIRRGIPSSRWRDLADVAMIGQQLVGIDARVLRARLDAEIMRRADTLPDGLPDRLTLSSAQLLEWSRAWGTGGRTVPIGLDESLVIARALIDPILGGTSGAGHWDTTTMAWVEP